MSFGTRPAFAMKKALKEAVAAGQTVRVYDTSMFGTRGTMMITELQSMDVIVGPDPYANFKDGKVV